MHFTRVRPSGFWVDGGALLASEMAVFDEHQLKAINGDEGGSWSPSSVIEIGGAGAKFTGPFWSTGTFRVDGLADLKGGATVTGGDLVVSQDASVQGALEVDGLATVDELAVVNGANIQGNAAVQGALAVTGNIGTDGDVFCERVAIHGGHLGANVLSVNGAARITGNCEIDGATACNDAFGVAGSFVALGPATFGGPISISKVISTSGEGRVRLRFLALTDVNATISINDCDAAHMASGVMTAARTIAVTTTGAAAGDVLHIANDNTYLLTVRLGSMVGPTLASLLNSVGAESRSVTLIYSGSTWLVLHRMPVPLEHAGFAAHDAEAGLHADAGQRLVVWGDAGDGLGLVDLVDAITIHRWFVVADEPVRAATRSCRAHIARRAGTVAGALRVADLGALSATGAGAGLLLPRCAGLRGLGVVGGAGEEKGKEEGPGTHEAHGSRAVGLLAFKLTHSDPHSGTSLPCQSHRLQGHAEDNLAAIFNCHVAVAFVFDEPSSKPFSIRPDSCLNAGGLRPWVRHQDARFERAIPHFFSPLGQGGGCPTTTRDNDVLRVGSSRTKNPLARPLVELRAEHCSIRKVCLSREHGVATFADVDGEHGPL